MFKLGYLFYKDIWKVLWYLNLKCDMILLLIILVDINLDLVNIIGWKIYKFIENRFINKYCY